MGLIQELEAEAIAAFNEGKSIPEFRPGDTLRVGVRVVEGERTRVQNYEGVCIARSNRGINSNFTVRKMSFGEGVWKVWREAPASGSASRGRSATMETRSGAHGRNRLMDRAGSMTST